MSDQNTETNPDPSDAWAEATRQERNRWVAAVEEIENEIHTGAYNGHLSLLHELLTRMEES